MKLDRDDLLEHTSQKEKCDTCEYGAGDNYNEGFCDDCQELKVEVRPIRNKIGKRSKAKFDEWAKKFYGELKHGDKS